MKQKILTQAIILLALFTTATALQAQVTIGSSTPPRVGALLDLTEGATTTHGLNMPRVELIKLKPTNGAELAASIGGTGNWILADHTALAVYNTKADKCAMPEPIYKGLYVFDGAEWQYLGKKPEPSPEVHTFTDPRDNNTYRYRNFGAIAGDWMLENLRYIPKAADGFTGFTHTAVAAPAPYTAKYWCYPWKGDGSANPPYNALQAEADWEPRIGIAYNWPAATNGENTSTVDQGQVSGSTPGANEVETVKESSLNAKDGKIRGICPVNWHVPSDREWNELEKELYNNAHLYSQYKDDGSDDFAPTIWQSSWETIPSWRGSTSAKGHGVVMKSECAPPGSTLGSPGGKSLSAAQGGFDALLVGANGSAGTFGEIAPFWSASAGDNTHGWCRSTAPISISSLIMQVGRIKAGKVPLYPVRCKKD
ncbi:FISUMP domain-containing protein [Dysgonomonas sp. 25]|uniref:FISUMP domain-containing protein n=1 Tax=Dysgonomonas sp. 25 TaxID=2302933 RepID=UPI0013D3616D|nr:FISUMP domain-containing protein [Dysgonomonas sp. 25]NDV69098.1 hypothetical protein [Dysgonomonas sp. 25]